MEWGSWSGLGTLWPIYLIPFLLAPLHERVDKKSTLRKYLAFLTILVCVPPLINGFYFLWTLFAPIPDWILNNSSQNFKTQAVSLFVAFIFKMFGPITIFLFGAVILDETKYL